MSCKSPVVSIPTRHEKVAFLTLAHSIGFSWSDTLAESIISMDQWRVDVAASIIYGSLRVMKVDDRTIRVFSWLTKSDFEHRLNVQDSTLVNSLDHMKSYAIRNKMV